MFALHNSFTTSCIKLARKRGRYFRIGGAPVSVVAAFFVAPTSVMKTWCLPEHKGVLLALSGHSNCGRECPLSGGHGVLHCKCPLVTKSGHSIDFPVTA